MGDHAVDKTVTGPLASPQNRKAQEGLLGGATTAAEFKQRSVRGGAAALFGQGLTMAMQIGSTLVLARILSPTDYGLQGMVLTLTGFFMLFQDAGLGTAAVQRESLTHEQLSALFWINLAVGIFLTIAVASAGPLLAYFYKDPRLVWITVVSSTGFLFSSLAVQHAALLNRAMRFTTGVTVGVIACTVGFVVAIVMAALGCGYWSLICQNISIPLASAIAFWIVMPWFPGRPQWTPELRSMMRFGGTVTLNGLVVYLAYNTEKILLGRFWGAAPLGLYGRAYQLSNLPMQQVTSSVRSVAFPVLSRMQSDAERLRRSFLKFYSFVISVTIPVVISCALFADEIVRIMLGPKWAGAAVILRLLSPTVLVFALVNPLSWFLQATGRVERSLKIALLIAPVVILGVVAGLRHGPPGVALGYSTAMLLLAAPIVAWANHGTGITAGNYLDSIKRPLVAGAAGGLVGWLFKFAFKGALAPFPLLALELSILSAFYAWLLLFVMGQRSVYFDLLSHAFKQGTLLPAKS